MNTKEGFTLTRSANGGGSFNFVCNGGGYIRLSFLRHPFGAVERSFFIGGNEILDVGNIFIDDEEKGFNNNTVNEQCRSANIAHQFKPKLFTKPISSGNFNVKMGDGSRVDVESRSVDIRSTIEKTNNIQLVYNSDRSASSNSILYIQLLDKQIPLNLQLVYLNIQIVGKTFVVEFKPKSNLQYIFVWDRLNVFGQAVIGLTRVRGNLFALCV